MQQVCSCEKVAVVIYNNGERFETYHTRARFSTVCLNGPRRKVQRGDIIIIMSYAIFRWKRQSVDPTVINLDGRTESDQ